MKIPNVSADTWRKLYSAAEEFRKLAPWNFMFDDTIFAVRERTTGLTYYCCVLGALGEVFALCAYRGDEGYHSWEQMHSGEYDESDTDIFFSQNFLMVEFVNKGQLEAHDKKIIKSLGLAIKGRNAHSCFRNMIPECPPWFINEDEAQALISILHCACLFAVECKKNPKILEPGVDGLVLYLPEADTPPGAPVPTIIENPPIKKERTAPKIDIDPFTMKKLKNAKLNEGLTWEADTFINVGMTVSDHDRPYWLRTVIVADSASFFILHLNPIGPENDPISAIAQAIVEVIKKYDHKPSEIHIRDSVLLKTLAPIAKELGVSVKIKKHLPAVLMIKEDISRNLRL